MDVKMLLVVNYHYIRDKIPHTGIHPITPLFFKNQLELIRLISNNLPMGRRLLVKEHPVAIGKRNVKSLKGWRYQIFGSAALKFIEGKSSIKNINGKIIID